MMVMLQEIWDFKLPEGQKLEYKQYVFDKGQFKNLDDSKKRKLGQVISSFANADGGSVILGIAEDENHNPSALVDVGIDQKSFESWEQSFRQYISSKIKPVIYGIDCYIDQVENVNLIKIDIPKSINKPHAINNGSKDELFIRYGNMTNPMLLDDLRNAFEDKNITENKIIGFKNERLSMILGNEIFEDLDNDSVLVIHIIPEVSTKLNNYVDLRKAEHNQKLDVFSPTGMGGGYRKGNAVYNMDGLMIFYESFNNAPSSYTQLFHNGSLEMTEVRLMNRTNDVDGKDYIYDWYELEKLLASKIYTLSKVMKDIQIQKPYYVFTTLLNVKGKQSRGSFDLYPDKPINRNVVHSVPAYIKEDTNFESALFPLLTSLANAFGVKNSGMYLEDGTPNIERFDFIPYRN